MSKAQKGNVFTRTEGGRWYCQWYVNGKQFVKALSDATGKPIAGASKAAEREARKAADLLVRPYTARDKAELRQEAVNALAGARAAAEAAEIAARPRLPLAEVWTRFPYESNTRGSVERKLAARTVTGTRQQWEVFTGWAADKGIRNAEDVTRDHAEVFRRELPNTGRSADLTNRICVVCRMMFRRAGIEPNPFGAFRRLAYKPTGRRELTEPELRAVCGSATGELRRLLALGLYTGLRLGDACQLDWSEVSPDLTRIIREPGKTSYKGTEVVIPTHPVLATILGETPAEERTGPVLPDLCLKYRADAPGVSKMVGEHFEANGIRLHAPGTGRARDPETGRLVSTGRRAVTEVSFHSMRHSFVSLAARHGVPLHVVQALAGHASPEIQRRYLHASPADLRQAVAALPAVIGEPETPVCAELRAEVAKLLPQASEGQLRAALAALTA